MIGLLAAKHFPERVSGLVLINSGIPKSSDVLPQHIRKGYEKELEMLSQNYGDIGSYLQQWEQSQNVTLSNDAKDQLSFDFKKEKDSNALKPRTNLPLAKHDMDRIAKDSLRLDQMFNSTQVFLTKIFLSTTSRSTCAITTRIHTRFCASY